MGTRSRKRRRTGPQSWHRTDKQEQLEREEEHTEGRERGHQRQGRIALLSYSLARSLNPDQKRFKEKRHPGQSVEAWQAQCNSRPQPLATEKRKLAPLLTQLLVVTNTHASSEGGCEWLHRYCRFISQRYRLPLRLPPVGGDSGGAQVAGAAAQARTDSR